MVVVCWEMHWLATFIVSIKDVTNEVFKDTTDLSPLEFKKVISKNIVNIQEYTNVNLSNRINNQIAIFKANSFMHFNLYIFLE